VANNGFHHGSSVGAGSHKTEDQNSHWQGHFIILKSVQEVMKEAIVGM
jgi:hypothetical protein